MILMQEARLDRRMARPLMMARQDRRMARPLTLDDRKERTRKRDSVLSYGRGQK